MTVAAGCLLRWVNKNCFACLIVQFMLTNRVLSESVCRLFPLVLADLVDEDSVRHSRVSGSIHGCESSV